MNFWAFRPASASLLLLNSFQIRARAAVMTESAAVAVQTLGCTWVPEFNKRGLGVQGWSPCILFSSSKCLERSSLMSRLTFWGATSDGGVTQSFLVQATLGGFDTQKQVLQSSVQEFPVLFTHLGSVIR